MDIKATTAFDQVDDLFVDIQRNSQAAKAMAYISEIINIMLGDIFCTVDNDCAGPGHIVDSGFHSVEAERIALAARINFRSKEKARAALK